MPINARSYPGLLVLGLGTLVGPLDSSVNIAFPYITGAFGVPLEDIRWVIVSYVLTYSSLMLVFGNSATCSVIDLFSQQVFSSAPSRLSCAPRRPSSAGSSRSASPKALAPALF